MSRGARDTESGSVEARQRLDKYLWFARMARTRVLAAGLVTAGHVRVNGRKVDQPSRAVGPGDVLTISLSRDVRVLRVTSLSERRGPFEEARKLYEDLSAPPAEVADESNGEPRE